MASCAVAYRCRLKLVNNKWIESHFSNKKDDEYDVKEPDYSNKPDDSTFYLVPDDRHWIEKEMNIANGLLGICSIFLFLSIFRFIARLALLSFVFVNR